MTISSQINKITHIGNGIATEFVIPFYFLEASHLEVYQFLNDIQTTPSNYSVQGVKNLNGGTIIFDTPPASGAEILIMRNVPMTQDVDYQENEIFPAETHEMTLDKLTMGLQQLSERIDRAVSVDIFSEENGSDLLPSIKQSVSDSASYAQIATEQAELATEKAQMASEKADVSTEKANEATASLENKVNIDADNFSQTGKEEIIGWGLPDYSAEINLYEYIGNGEYITPCNGFIIFQGNSNTITFCNSTWSIGDGGAGSNFTTSIFIIPANTVCVFAGPAFGRIIKFYPIKGEA